VTVVLAKAGRAAPVFDLKLHERKFPLTSAQKDITDLKGVLKVETQDARSCRTLQHLSEAHRLAICFL
jgi:hypothetical protein